MNKKFTHFRWLAAALMLVAAMVMPFGAWAEENNNVGYAVFNSATGTLTFKYGVKPSAGDNETVYDLNTEENDPGWTTNKSSIEAVVFDETFQDARPTSCFKWFYYCYNLTTITDIQYLNTSEVTSMVYMFLGCTELTSLDLSSFNTQKVKNMNRMFRYCEFTTLDLSSFNTGSVNNMSGMFQECSNLTTLTLPSNFDTSEVTDMSSMFYGCSGLTSLDLSSFNTSKVTEMYNMFNGCSKLNTIYVSDMFTTVKVTSSESMFNGCTNLKGAISYGSEKANDKTYANYLTGYFSYGIKTAADLNTFAQYVNGTYTPADGECATVHPTVSAGLMNDITLTAEVSFTPISSYMGTFDGRQHVISGLNFGSDATSLFTYNNGTIKNLGVVNATIAEGSNGSICQTNSGTISSSFFMGTTEGTSSPGGAVCQTNSESGTITNCYYLASNDDSNGGKTAAQFASGEVAWLLNGGTTDGTQMWYQNIDNNETPDAYPVLDSTHGTVYQCTNCTGTYSNTENKYAEHSYTAMLATTDEHGLHDVVCAKCAHPTTAVKAVADFNRAGECLLLAAHDDGTYSADEVTLYDTDEARLYNNPVSVSVGTLHYTRTFDHDRFAPLYVPFAMSPADWGNAFEVYAVSNVQEYTPATGATQVQLEVRKVTAGTLRPNTPYLIRAVAGEQTVTLTDVTLQAATANAIGCNSMSYSYTLNGSYTAKTDFDLATDYTLESGLWVRPDGELAPQRWYLCAQPVDGLSAEPVDMIGITEQGSGVVTDLDQIRVVVSRDEAALAGLYTEAGRIVCAGECRIYDLLGRDVTRLNGSLCGVYVVKIGEAAVKVVVR